MKTIKEQQIGDLYTCDIGISKDEWLSILQDKGTSDRVKDALLCFYYMPNHRGSCTLVGKAMNRNPYSLNSLVTQFGKKIQRLYKDQFEVIGLNGVPSFWNIPMNKGKILSSKDEGSFEWELREELAEAIREYLYWYLLDQYKLIRREFPIDSEESYELYKWKLITVSQGKAPIQILKDHVAHPGKASLGGFENLIFAAKDNKTLKYLVEEKTTEFESILNRLADGVVPLDVRLEDFKVSVAALLPSEGYGSKANDERTAATILTCLEPDIYTFYKHRELYPHYML